MKKLVLFALGLPKTLWFNFRYFRLKDAIRLPVLVSHRVWLKKMAGEVELGVVRIGVVKIGFGDVGIFDQHRSRSIWEVSGKVRFEGKAKLGHGSKISVDGYLGIGKNFRISAESTIVVRHRIIIGDEVLCSFGVLLLDNDSHKIFDRDGHLLNPSRPIRIGNKVWIGCRALILKGVDVADGVVIAANTTLSKSIGTAHAIVGGNPVRVLRENVRWEP